MALDKYSPERKAARERAVDQGRFSRSDRANGTIKCVLCGDSGHPRGSWMDKHIGPHDPCPDCDTVRPRASMNQHRAHHRRKR